MLARFLADPRFQRWATRTPLVRIEANRRARAAFDLVAGFVYSQVLAACVELDLLSAVAGRAPRPAAELAATAVIPPEAMQRLLDAATALRILCATPTGYVLGSVGAMIAANPGVLAMVRHHRLLYADLADPVALLRGTASPAALAAFWPYAGASPEDRGALPAERVAEYTALMAASQPMVADGLLDAFPLGRIGRVLDVGGGDGAFLAEAARRHPALHLTLFDLPAVAEQARARFAHDGLEARSAVVAGDFLTDALPTGADLVTLVRVLHDQDDEGALRLLRAVRDALPPGGLLLIGEPLAGTAGAEPVGAAYFGLYLLAMGRGRARTADEIGQLLGAAGFTHARTLPTPTPLLTGAIMARRAPPPPPPRYAPTAAVHDRV